MPAAGGPYSSSPYPVSLASASDHGVLERTAEATDSFKGNAPPHTRTRTRAHAHLRLTLRSNAVLRLNLNKQYIPSLPPMIGTRTCVCVCVCVCVCDDEGLPAVCGPRDSHAVARGATTKNVGRLRFLQTINLRRNHLQELPAEFGELRDLQYLTLSFNRLQRLPGNSTYNARVSCRVRVVSCRVRVVSCRVRVVSCAHAQS
jgi:hypothetical protein